MQTVDIYEINEYIKKTYQVDTLVNTNFQDLDQICFKNKKLYYPFCSLYIDLCPSWGYAPNKLLIHHSKEKKDHTGASGSIVYNGIESIDWVMQNVFEIEKKEEQLTLF